MSDIKLTAKQIRAIGELATADAEHATHNESATDVYGQVMGKPVGQDFDRMSAIYDAYVNLWEHARSAVETTDQGGWSLAETNSLDAAPVETNPNALELARLTREATPVLRVRIHPAHDLFMRGVRYATVTGATLESVKVRQDGTGKSFRVRNEYIMPLNEGDTLIWVIVLPGEGDVDETFAPSYLDALAFARSMHGATAVIRLTGWESN